LLKFQQKIFHRSPLNLESLNREDRNLFLFSMFMVLLLSLFILSIFLPNSLGDFETSSVKPHVLVTILTLFGGIIIFCCGYLYFANRKIGVLRQTLIEESTRLEGLKQRVEELSALLDVSRTLTSKRGVRVVMSLLVRKVRECLKADLVTLMLLEGSLDRLVPYAASGDNENEALNREIEEGGYEWWIVHEGEAIRYPGDQKTERFSHLNLPTNTCVLGVPLKLDDVPIGVLTGIRCNDKKPFSETDLKLLSIFGNDAIMAIEKEIFHYNEKSTDSGDTSEKENFPI